jgi:hypothetical protein
MHETLEAEFWGNVYKPGPTCSWLGGTDCWVWVGGVHHGYGRFHGRRAAEVAYELLFDPVPAHAWFDFRCRRRRCVNVVDHHVVLQKMLVF